MIPSSSAPLIFAQQFDASSASVVATAIMLGLAAAGPMMFTSALFLEFEDMNMAIVIAQVQLVAACVSLSFGVLCIVMMALCCRNLKSADPLRVLIFTYGIVTFVYESLMLWMNPLFYRFPCVAFNDHAFSSMAILVGWIQNVGQLVVVMLQFLLMMRVLNIGGSFFRTSAASVWAVLACLGFAFVPALLTIPNTIAEMCSIVGDRKRDIDVWANAIWIYFLILIMTVQGLCFRLNVRKSVTVQSDENDYAGVLGTDAEEEAEDEVIALQVVYSSLSTKPMTVIRGLIFTQFVRLAIRVVNTAQVLLNRSIVGSFAQMLVVEGFLEHLQLPVFTVLLVLDETFATDIIGGAHTLVRWWFSSGDVQDSVHVLRQPGVSRSTTSAF
eukprot:TRINITY_DN39677_c0_g1_i1.p1 TRINITY_DN39677_c0_g1~~TRINITY_DN39677_c0_g1_i1.p1  ORF type:complete len:432 (-),score=35.22 TRINITY_DN39677_c0_g1_i1:173-1324(-)